MTDYSTVHVYTHEKAKYEGQELGPAVVSFIHSLKIAARCVVFRGVEGCYENGSLVTQRIVELSYHMPLVIEILLPSEEVPRVLEKLKPMVSDGIITLSKIEVVSFQAPRSILPPHLLVRDVMTSKPIFAHTDFSVRTAVELMMDYQLKSLPVVDKHHHLEGMVTQSDLVERAGMPSRFGLFARLGEEELEGWLTKMDHTPLASIMTKNPQAVREDHRVAEAIHLMVRKNLKRLPVVDAQGTLRGVISRIDTLKALSASASQDASDLVQEGKPPAAHVVRDLTARESVSLSPELHLKIAIDKLGKLNVQRAAVTDDQGKLIGLITDSLILKALDSAASPFHPWKQYRTHGGSDITVKEIMERNVVSVTEDTPIEEVLRVFVERGFKRIPVVDQDGTFKGLLRRDSLLTELSYRV